MVPLTRLSFMNNGTIIKDMPADWILIQKIHRYIQ
jgi:hypothetical protein